MLLRLLTKLPLRLLYIIARVVYFIAFYLVRYRRKVVDEHLRTAFPDWPEDKISKVTRDFYRNLADVAVEIIAVGGMTKQELARRVQIGNLDVVMDLVKQGQSFIFLSGHVANWEWLSLAVGQQLPIPMSVAYKPLHNKAADDYMIENRTGYGVRPVELSQFTNEVIKNKNKQCIYAFLADQRPAGGSKFYTTQFLNRESPFYVGPEKIAQFAKIPVLFVRNLRTSRGHYRVEFEVIAEPPHQKRANQYPITERYVRELEKLILEQPESWLWSYRRWRKQMIVVPKTPKNAKADAAGAKAGTETETT